MEENINERLLKNILGNGNISRPGSDEEQLVVLETNLYEPPQGAQSISSFFKLCDHRNVEGEASKCLFMKVSKTVDNMESYNLQMFFNDAYFYCKIVPFFQTFGDTSSFLQNYLGSSLNWVGEMEKCALVAENLQAAGYRHISPKSRWDYPHLALVLQKLGEFHAFSYKAKSLEPKRFYSLVADLNRSIETNAIVVEEMLKGNLIDVLENMSPEDQFMEKNASCVKRTEYIVENMLTELRKQLAVHPDTDENSVLCHGDMSPLNFMFTYENGMPTNVKIVDFSNCQLGSPALDVVYFLYCSTDEKMRHEHWDDLIDLYYSALSRAFIDNVIPSKGSIIKDFPLHALWAVLIGLNWPPFLMALDDMGDNIPENISISDIRLISKSKTAERIALFKDMVQRNFI